MGEPNRERAKQPVAKPGSLEGTRPYVFRFGACHGEAVGRIRDGELTPRHLVMNPYSNPSTQLLDRLAIDADAHAAKHSAWLAKLATAEAGVASAEEIFAAEPTEANATGLLEAKDRARNFQQLAEVVTNHGGPSEAKLRKLKSSAVFAAFVKAFDERIAALNKLAPVALKKLGERRASLTEDGTHFMSIERDEIVAALRAYCESVAGHVQAAIVARNYCLGRGENRTPVSFGDLYANVTSPLPQAPTIPAAK